MTGTGGTSRVDDSPGTGRSDARGAVRETGATPGGTPYSLHGTGEPIVLVAGAGGTGRIWERHTVPALTAAGRLVVTFDHEAADEAELAFALGELLTSLKLTSCPLVGHSLGALAVQELLLTDPRPAGGAVLVATRGRPDPVGEALARAEDACARAGIRLPPEYQASVRLAQNLSPRTLADDRAVTEWLDIFELAALMEDPATRPPGLTVTGDPAARPSRLTLTENPAARLTLTENPAALPPRRSVRNRLAELGRITTPLLVVGFADDVLAPAPLGREVAGAVPGARYAELADTGHLGFLERPDAFHTVLLDFLATLPPTDPEPSMSLEYPVDSPVSPDSSLPLGSPATATVHVVHVGEEAPASWAAAVYLCGPTPADPAEPSWRPEAVAALRAIWRGAGTLTVFLPEPAPGGSYPAYADQIEWEEDAMRRSDVILFWIPRDMERLPGLVSNIKWGAWYDSGRAVLGTPPEAERMAYLLHFAEAIGVPVERSIAGAAGAALRAVGQGSPRTGGERTVPLPVWRSERFRAWYAERTAAGDRLLDARVEWYTREGDGAAWLLTVTVAPGDGSARAVHQLLSAQGQGLLM